MTWCGASVAVVDQKSSCARETKKGYSSLASRECPFPGSGIAGTSVRSWLVRHGTSVGIFHLLFARARCGDVRDQLVSALALV